MSAKARRYPIPVVTNIVAVVACSAIYFLLFYAASRATTAAGVIASALLFAVVMISIYSLIHEAEHGLLVPNPAWNRILGRWLCALFGVSFAFLTHCHMRHHWKNRTDSEIWDLYLPNQVKWKRRFSLYLMLSGVVIHQDYVFITANYSMSAYAVQIVLSNSVQVPQPRWTNTVQRSHWSTPVTQAGHLYGMFYPDNANGQLRCIDLATGTTRWAANDFGRSSLLLAGTNLLCLTERGSLVLVAAQTNAYQELGRFLAIPNYHSDTNKCWNGMALSDGQVYVRSTASAARFDLSMPDLLLDPPRVERHSEISFAIRTVTGDPISSNRLAGVELRASTNATLSPALWPKLNNTPVLSNGVALVSLLDIVSPRLFFITSEPSDLALPRLKLDTLQFANQTKVSLVIRSATGTPINSDRLTSMEVRSSTNASLSPALWPKLNNTLILSNGLVTVTNIDGSPQKQFFIISEPQ